MANVDVTQGQTHIQDWLTLEVLWVWVGSAGSWKQTLQRKMTSRRKNTSHTGEGWMLEGDFRRKEMRRGLIFHFQEITRFNMRGGGAGRGMKRRRRWSSDGWFANMSGLDCLTASREVSLCFLELRRISFLSEQETTEPRRSFRHEPSEEGRKKYRKSKKALKRAEPSRKSEVAREWSKIFIWDPEMCWKPRQTPRTL